MNRQLLLLALLLAAAGAQAEQVYKWTDAAGIVHYSDSPPPAEAQNVQTVKVSGGDRPRAISGGETPPPAGMEGSKPPAANAPPPTMADTPENRAKNCQQARSNLEMLNSKYPIAQKSDDGKQSLLDDKARQAAIANANQQVAQYCTSG